MDLELASPGAATLTWIGHRLRPLLAPVTLRAKPHPPAARVGLAAGVLSLAVLGAGLLLRGAGKRRDAGTGGDRHAEDARTGSGGPVSSGSEASDGR